MCKLSHEAYFENQAQELKIPKFENLITEKKSKQLQKVKRPWILTRSGYSGIQEYAQTWTGDNYSNFKALKYDQAIFEFDGLKGLTYSGSDIGGFWEIAQIQNYSNVGFKLVFLTLDFLSTLIKKKLHMLVCTPIKIIKVLKLFKNILS